MKIAACLIVKDSSATIEACLDSIRPFVDEVNVYDTGSTDDTLEVLERLSGTTELLVSNETGEIVGSVHLPEVEAFEPVEDGAILPDYTISFKREKLGIGKDVGFPEINRLRDELTHRVPLAPIRVEQGEWRDDFSWAREQSFAMASDDVEWFFWLDDDDVIVGAQNLRTYVHGAESKPELDGFVFHYTYARDEHNNCFPAGTEIFSSPVVASTSRWYEGELIRLSFASGNELSVTPNHPILTPEGWVAAGALDEGDGVLRGSFSDFAAVRRSNGNGPDQHQVPALIEEVASSFGTHMTRTITAADDFHGDGIGSEVHVVRSDRLLPDVGQAERVEQQGKGIFEAGGGEDAPLASERSGFLRGRSVALATPSLLRSRGVEQPKLGRFETLPEHARLATAPTLDASGIEPQVDGAAGDIETARKAVDGFAGQVEVDEIFGVERVSEWSGHVYNLETEENWYAANGVIVHNCICELWRERLMRRSAGYTWKGAVHEVLVPPEGKEPVLANIPKEQVDYIHDRPADRYSPERNLTILLAAKERIEAAGDTVDPRTLAYLGTEYMAKGQFVEAVGYLQDYLNRPDAGWSDERMQVAHKLATCLRMMGNPLAAVEVEWQAMLERDDWGETAVGLCESFTMLGRWDRVETWAKRALDLGMPQSMLILNPLEFTFVPVVRLAEAAAATDRFDEAIAWLEHAQRVVPAHPMLIERRAQYDQGRYDHQLLTSFLTVREGLIRHDENWKAYELMKAVPYRIADHPMIVKARADSRENVLHALQPEEYTRWYSEEPKESTLTDDMIDLVGEGFGRVGGLLKGLQAQEEDLGRKPVLLDLGCNDWWMGEFFARQGYRCDGVELNRRSYEKAIDRRERFEREATIVHGDLHDAENLLSLDKLQRNGHGPEGPDWRPQYDAVSLFEVIEHVPDIQATLDLCESLLRPGGRVYVSTPDGAFENGNIAGWAKVERKGHLRAMPIHELAEILNARGEVQQLEHTNGDNIAFASYTPAPKKGKVIFYAGGGWEQWSPASIHTTGLGGSETALVQVSTRFAMDGYEVKVYAGAEPGLYEALWRPHTAWDPTEECDLLVISRLPHALDNPIAAKHTALWCHDHSYPGILTEARAENVDSVIVLSEWERDRYARLYPFLEGKLVVIRNGITVHDVISGETRFPDADRSFEERKPRCLFTSSADRGLDVMLEVWPEIREQVPDAELHVFYGFDVFDRVALTNPQLFAYKAQLLGKVGELGGEDAGIFLRGRVGQRELYDEMQQARVWSYPTAFLETSCIGAMEARACGLPIVSSDLGALKESAGSHGQLIPWAEDEDEPHNRSPEYRSWFVGEVNRLLTDEKHWSAWHRRALAGVDSLDWSERMPQWEAQMAAEVREAVPA